MLRRAAPQSLSRQHVARGAVQPSGCGALTSAAISASPPGDIRTCGAMRRASGGRRCTGLRCIRSALNALIAPACWWQPERCRLRHRAGAEPGKTVLGPAGVRPSRQ